MSTHITLGFRVLFRARSVGGALSIVLERFPTLPKAIFYDVACKIDKNAMRRVRPILRKQGVRCILDRPHSITHSCSPVYMPDQSLGTTAGVATQAAEVSHSVSVGNRTSLAYMAPATYMIHRMIQVAFMNTRKLYRLHADNPRAENDHIELAGFFHARLSRTCQIGAACSCDASAALVATHHKVIGRQTRDGKDADSPTATRLAKPKNDGHPIGVAVGDDWREHRHSVRDGDGSGHKYHGDGEEEASIRSNVPVATGVDTVLNEAASSGGDGATPGSPLVASGPDNASFKSLMLDADDEALDQADASSSEIAGSVPSASPPAVTPVCVRALSASCVVGPDTAPLLDDLAAFVTSLVSGREYGELVRRKNKARVALDVSDFCRLRGTGWMNDEIMNSYVALLNWRNDDIRKARASGSSSLNGVQLLASTRRTFCFNTYFFSRLWSARMGYDYDCCKRWGTKLGLSVGDVDLIIVPINLKSVHWVLAVIDIEKWTFQYCDSFLSSDPIDAIGTTRRWLKDEVQQQLGSDALDEMDIDGWQVLQNDGVPEQTDGGSCGVFSLLLADCLSLGLPATFGQRDMPVLRLRLAVDLFLDDLVCTPAHDARHKSMHCDVFVGLP